MVHHPLSFLPLSLLLFCASVIATASTISTASLALVKARLASDTTDTWVAGTRTEALLENDYPLLSVFAATPFPPPTSKTIPTETNAIIAQWAAIRPVNASQFAVVAGGAAGDPASLGVAWILAGLSQSALNVSYAAMVKEEMGFLTGTVLRTHDGAISTRPLSEPVQLWADFVYMVPPFLAYYGVLTNNATLIKESFNQCSLYRQYLRDPTSGLWRHIVLGSWQDTGLWGTGNAWAAAGMTRVLASIQHSSFAAAFTAETADLATWVNEILTASFSHIDPTTHLLPNYYNVTGTFGDSSSSALLAATAYRIASLGRAKKSAIVETAESIRVAIYANVNPTTGWLSPVVNPLSWQVKTNESPEGQAFVLLMEAGWNAWTVTKR